jgi:hypothetical protein
MKRPPVVLLVLTLALPIAVPVLAPACPVIANLWDWVRDAELIVLARVESIEIAAIPEEAGDAGPRARDTAVLRILETWKGEHLSEVRVQFDAASPWSHYREGEVVLAFLESGETRAANALRSMGDVDTELLLSYGIDPEEIREIQESAVRSREELRQFAEWATGRWLDLGPLSKEIDRPAESERDTLKELVELAIRLQKAGGDEQQAPREWLLAAAERRITRGESIDLLRFRTRGAPPFLVEQDGEEAEISEEEEEEEEEAALEPLTHDELARLAAGFVREPGLDDTDADMLKVLADHPDAEVDRVAASVIEAGLLERPIPEWVPPLVAEVLRRYGDDFSARIGRDDRDPRGRPIYTGEGDNTLPTIWEVARRDLGIPAVPPAHAPKQGEQP